MNSLNKLAEIFRQFPGIGPRQAGRFVYFLITRDKKFLDEFSKLIADLKKEVLVCVFCRRFFFNGQNGQNVDQRCSICANPNRSREKLMIVAKDIDLETIEKSGLYNGMYFVLGGTVPILDKEPAKRIRLKEFVSLVKKTAGRELKEIILAFNANPEGENTADFVKETLKPLIEKLEVKVSSLGRGLSTGTELEYSDAETLKNALKHRE